MADGGCDVPSPHADFVPGAKTAKPSSDWSDGCRDLIKYTRKILGDDGIVKGAHVTQPGAGLSGSGRNGISAGQHTAEALPPDTEGWGNLLDKYKPKPGTWICQACLVPNDAHSIKCVACETPKPGAAPSSGNASSSKGSNGAFRFAGSVAGGSGKAGSGFNFSAPKPASSANPSSTFSFGVKKAESPPPASAPPAGSTFNFSFGAKKPDASSSEPSFKKPDAGASASAGAFSFNFKAPTEKPAGATTFGASPFSFKASTPAAPAAPAGSTSGGRSDGAAAGEEDKARDERVEVIRADDGDEETKHEVRAKALRFDKGGEGEAARWREMGVGVLRVMVSKTQPDKARLVLRNDVGKVRLNIALYKGMKVEDNGKALTFVAALEEHGLSTIMLKTKAQNLAGLSEAIDAQIPK